MVACVSVAADDLTETLCTLEYASKAALVHNRLVANVTPATPVRDAGREAEYEEEARALREELVECHAVSVCECEVAHGT
jgi:hypothetical protein